MLQPFFDEKEKKHLYPIPPLNGISMFESFLVWTIFGWIFASRSMTLSKMENLQLGIFDDWNSFSSCAREILGLPRCS